VLFLLIFPVLVAGYRASLIHPVIGLANARHQGQRLYLSSATMGLKCFAIGGTIAYGLHSFLPNEVNLGGWTLECSNRVIGTWSVPCQNWEMGNLPVPLDLSSLISSAITEMGAVTPTDAMNWTWFILLSLATWLAGDLLRFNSYLFQAAWHGTWEIKIPITGKLLAESPMDYLLFIAMHTKKPVMLSMNDRKVYVGYVAACAEPSQNGGAYQEVTLVPMMSGYRDENSLRIYITTYYDDADQSVELIVRQDAILSAGEFNWEAFEKLQPKKPAPTRKRFNRNRRPATLLVEP
jgi:hypothetical protein